ncbi:MAG: hypothetical protein NC924_02370 [Candidatus Omnitrophica bacterium]|nr:hypothetical protein [Candidatus Omnitrophota bacterium]
MAEMTVYYMIIGTVSCMLIAAHFFWIRRSPEQPASAAAAEAAAPALDAQTRTLVNEVMPEIVSTMQLLTSRLEEKETRLQRLMAEADQKIGTLERHLKTAPSGAPLSVFPDKYNQVFALQEQGKSVKEIARALNIEQGKVELLCNLRKKT